MNNKIQETMEHGAEEFMKEFGSELGHESGYATTVQPRDIEEYQDWLKSHQKALLEAVLEEVKEAEEEQDGIYINTIDIDIVETIINKAIGV